MNDQNGQNTGLDGERAQQNARGIVIPVTEDERFLRDLRSLLADCSEFLADEGASTEAKESNALADRCEAMLSQVVAWGDELAAPDHAVDRFATPEELLDRCWQQLELELVSGAEDNDVRVITRDQLAEFMAEAALHAIGADPLTDHGRGPVDAMLQSLRVLSSVLHERGEQGHVLIVERAVATLEGVTNDVTRFLEHPGCLVTHAKEDRDLSVAAVRFYDDGRTMVTCRVPGSEMGEHGQWQFPLSQLYPAGPVSDAVRIIAAQAVQGIAKDMVDAMAGNWGVEGGLPKLEPVAYLVDQGGVITLADKDDPNAFAVFGRLATGGTIDTDKVHHLQAEREYVMAPGSAHAEPVKQPWVERSTNDLCPGCHLPLHSCTCVPMDG